MAKMRPKPAPPSDQLRIYEARLDKDGGVRRVRQVSEVEAIVLRKGGGNVVVCGDSIKHNRRLAQSIEQQASGRWKRHEPHASAGTDALPHCQPETRPPEGHTFYETNNLKAR